MQTSAISLAAVITLLGVGCTTLIGLPDLPDPPATGGMSASAGATSTAGTGTGELGDSGAAGTGVLASGGEANGGKSQGGSANGGGANGGSANGGGANGGGANGGSANGGTEQGGTAGAAQCTPPCVTGASCVADVCKCPQGQTMCVDACVDLATDKAHCGTCTTKCDSACSASRCYTKLADLPSDTTQVAVNASHVYFTQEQAGKVSRVPRAGGSVEVVAQTQIKPSCPVLDQNNVYWINNDYRVPTVQKLPLVGGDLPGPVASTGNNTLHGLAVDASFVYWSQDGLDASIIKSPLAGGTAVVLAPAPAIGSSSRALVLDATTVYWVSVGNGDNVGTVAKVPKAGGAVVTLASDLDSPSAIALYGGFVYFGNADAIYKVATSGGAISTVSLTGASNLAVDASGIYAAWGSGMEPLLQLTPAGASHATLAKRQAIRSIVLDGNSVFWGDSTSVNTTTKAP